MSHTRALVVIGGVVLSAALFGLGWILSSPWKVEDISMRGLPRPEAGKRNPELDVPPEFALQSANVTPFPDQPRDKVKRQSERAIKKDAVAEHLERPLPPPANAPQPAASDPFPDQRPAKLDLQPGPRETKLQLAEPRVALHGTPAEQLEQLLEQPVTMRVSNATVDDVVAMLRGVLPVNVLLDTKALEEAAFDDRTVMSSSTSAPLKLRQALNVLLGDAKLGFICENDSLHVTHQVIEEGQLDTKIYDVGDLIRPSGVEHEHETVDFDSLVHLISMYVLPPAYENNNGQPRIFPYEHDDLLVIPHTRRGHEQIAKLLNELRRGRGLKIPDTLKIAAPAVNLAQQQATPAATVFKNEALDPDARILRFEFTGEGLSADLLKKMKPAERVEYQLRRRALLQAQNVKLEDVVMLLRDKLQINILIDRKALEEAAFDTATPIRYLPNAGTRMSSSLRQMLNELALNICVEEESLLITTKVAQENRQYLRYYSVGELIRPIGTSAQFVPSDFDSLIQLIQSTIEPTTWKANGGQGDIAPQETLDLLIVSNTCQVLEQMDELIAQLRKIHAAKAETIQANEAVLQRVVYQLVLPRQQQKIKEEKGKDGLPVQEILLGDLQYSMDDLIEMIKKTIEPGSWTDDKHKIDALGESLIVTHSQATQRKLHEMLHDLGITQAQHQPLQQHGYGVGAFGGGGGFGGSFGGAQNSGGPVARPVGPQQNNNNNPAPNGGQNSGGIF